MAIKRYQLRHVSDAGVQETIYLETDGKSVMLDDGSNVQATLNSHQSSITSLSSALEDVSSLLDDLNGEVI